jgi:Tfp pilus assembly protein PilV
MFGLKKQFKKQDGQGLLELVIAIAVIAVGILSVWNFYLSNYVGEQDARHKIVATNLAREGVEVVKNIRDSNWLSMLGDSQNQVAWDTGLDSFALSTSTVVLSHDFPTSTALVVMSSPEKSRIYLKNNLYFNNSDGGLLSDASTTPYSRLIKLRSICCNPEVDNGEPTPTCADTAFVTSDNLICPPFKETLKIGIDVASQVFWLDNQGKSKNVAMEEQLFNWK